MASHRRVTPQPQVRRRGGRSVVKPRNPWLEGLRCFVQLVGGLLLITGLLVGCQVLWQYYGAGLDTTTTVKELEKSSTVKWETSSSNEAALHTDDAPVPAVARKGQLGGYLRIPALGADFKRPIVEGVDKAQLDLMGAGHYPQTALPGQKGNASYAGHRAPVDFGYLNRLKVGDRIIIETPDTWYVYSVNRTPYVVPMTQVEVVAPTAGGAERALTLTTCDPMLTVGHAVNRLIVHASFDGWVSKSEGVPAELAQTTTTPQERVIRSVTAVAEQRSLPVTGVAAGMLALAWLILDLFLWLVCHRMMWRGSWKKGGMLMLNPFLWLWRLMAGPVPQDTRTGGRKALKVLSVVIRLGLFALFWMAVMFAWWRYAAPWMANNIPMFETPHPTMEA